jgi:hypothetical protein
MRLAIVLLAVTVIACSRSRATMASRSIDDVLAAHSDSLMALPGVVGTAIGLCDAERCIKVLVADTSAETRGRIPRRLEGYRVVVEVTGIIRPR